MKTVKITSNQDLVALSDAFDFACGTVVALGFFDGVHLAHRALLSEASAIARKMHLPLTVFTFSGNSGQIKSGAKKLYSDEEKLSLLKECGVDCTLIADFPVFSKIEAADFVKDFLIGSLFARVAVCGYNFRFGKGALGTSDTLRKIMAESGAEARIIEEYTVSGVTLSSTHIRALLSERRVREASKLLGKPYFISGEVSHGLGLGKKLGIPTVNIPLSAERFVLPIGVYATAAVIDGRIFPALTNVGVCPTFEEREIHAETFILNFDEDAYGKNIRIYFVEFLRDEKQFSNANELIMQINIDKNRTLKLFGDVKWQELGLN